MATPPAEYSIPNHEGVSTQVDDTSFLQGAQQDLKPIDTVTLPRLSDQISKKLRNIEDQLWQGVTKLTKQQHKSFEDFILHTLCINVSEGKQTKILQSPKAQLFHHLQRYWNPICIDTLMQLANHLHGTAPQFKPMVVEYQLALHEFLRCGGVNWDHRTPLRQLAGYNTLVVRMNSSLQETTAKALDTLAFWAEKLKRIGSKLDIPVLLAGLTTNGNTHSLVFFIYECYILELFQWTQRNRSVICALRMETFTVPGLVTMNIGTGKTVHAVNLPPELRILVVGETGSGKSTLINNLLGKKMAPTADTITAHTTQIKRYQATVKGVPMLLYDTPGARNMDKTADRELQKKIKEVIRYNKLDLIIFCVQTIRFTDSHLTTLQLYHEAGVNWKNTVIALTFADRVQASKRERDEVGFDEVKYFTEKLGKWQTMIKGALVETVRVPHSVVDKISVNATAEVTEMKLQNGEEWFKPLLVNVLKVMPPTAAFRFFDKNSKPIHGECEGVVEAHQGMAQVLKEKVYSLLRAVPTGEVGTVSVAMATAAAIIPVIISV